MSKAMLAACEFFSVIDTPLPKRGWLKDPDVSATQDIAFNNATFAYPSRPGIKILDQLDLLIEAGKVTAIVGPSGSGKSTIVGLVQRWYTLTEQQVIAKAKQRESDKKSKKDQDVDGDNFGSNDMELQETEAPVALQGTVTTCGHSLDDVDIKWWRSQIGLVQQEPFLFNDTIYENVARGLIGSLWEDAPEDQKRKLVQEACQEAFADEFIEKLALVCRQKSRVWY